MWHNTFDKIFLINLPERRDRLEASHKFLSELSIPYEVVSAIKEEDGAFGLFMTILELFKRVEKEGLKNILVFEDDLRLAPGIHHFNERMNVVMNEVEELSWDMIYLGANVVHPLSPVSNHSSILRCDYMLSTVAVAYSEDGWRQCWQQMKLLMDSGKSYEPIDQLWASRVQQLRRKCYVTNPMLVYQRHDYSDILKSEVNYIYDWQKKFNQRLSEMNHGVM